MQSRAQAGPSKPARRASNSSSISASSLIDDLDEAAEKGDFDWKGLRERRLEALKAEVKRNEASKDDRHGRLTEVTNEKELISTSAKQRYCLIHFFHRNFTRCAIMDKHLNTLADKHRHTLFLRANVENAPFLTTRLGVKVLPCVVCFVDGNAVDRLVGFDDLGNSDSFPTKTLEARLARSGVLPPPGQVDLLQAKLAQRKAGSDESDQEDDDDAARDKAGRRKIVRSVRGGQARRQRDDDDDEWS